MKARKVHPCCRWRPWIAVILGCLVFVMLALQFQLDDMPAALIAIGTTFLFRVLAIHFNWKTSPVWDETNNRPPA